MSAGCIEGGVELGLPGRGLHQPEVRPLQGHGLAAGRPQQRVPGVNGGWGGGGGETGAAPC